MLTYRVDGALLVGAEAQQHRSALNASLNALIIVQYADDIKSFDNAEVAEFAASSACDFADAVVRELRRRSGDTSTVPPPPPIRYRLASDVEIIESWMNTAPAIWELRHNLAIDRIRAAGRALYPHELTQLAPTITEEIIAIMVKGEVLVPVEEEVVQTSAVNSEAGR